MMGLYDYLATAYLCADASPYSNLINHATYILDPGIGSSHIFLQGSLFLHNIMLCELLLVIAIIYIYILRQAQSRNETRVALRRLWSDHVVYTRLYLVARFAADPIADVYAARLMSNQADIGNALGAFYGKATGDAVTGLLKTHIGGAVVITTDLILKKDPSADITAWYKNGADIAAALNKINPTWTLPAMNMMMKAHLDKTITEATLLANKGQDHKKDIDIFDAITNDIMAMADMLADGGF